MTDQPHNPYHTPNAVPDHDDAPRGRRLWPVLFRWLGCALLVASIVPLGLCVMLLENGHFTGDGAMVMFIEFGTGNSEPITFTPFQGAQFCGIVTAGLWIAAGVALQLSRWLRNAPRAAIRTPEDCPTTRRLTVRPGERRAIASSLTSACKAGASHLR